MGGGRGADQPMPDAGQPGGRGGGGEAHGTVAGGGVGSGHTRGGGSHAGAAALSTMPAAAVEPTEHSPEAFNDFIRLYESRLTDDEGTSEDTHQGILGEDQDGVQPGW